MRTYTILFVCLAAALCLPAVAQDTPSPGSADSGPSLEVTMKFIQDKLSGIGQVRFNQQFADGPNNISLTIESDNILADSGQCSIHFRWKAWFNGDLNTKSERDINIPLRDVREVKIEPYEQYASELPYRSPVRETSTSPRVTALVLSGPNVVESTSEPNQFGVANIYVFPFLDSTLADRLRKAVTHAVELCAGGPQSPKQQLATIEPLPDIAAILMASLRQKIVFSREELQRLGDNAERLKEANRDGPYSAMNASVLGSSAEGVFGNRDPRVELAFQRGCALPYEQTRFINFCERLGDFYERRADPQMALSVYTLAPKCQSSKGAAAAEGPPCLRRAADLYLRLGYRDDARALYEKICSGYSIPYSCSQFTRLGGEVDLGTERARYAANIQRENDREQEAKEERAERARERNERFSAVVGALQSMPGGSDPNAIVNAGNQQAAAIRAIGDANAARQQQDAQMRLAAQRTTPPSTSQGSSIVAGPATTYQSPAQVVTSSTGAQSSVSNSLANGGASNSSLGPSTHQYLTPLAASCVRQFWDPKTYNWLSLENDCGQPIYLTFIFHHPGGWAMSGGMNLAPGASNNTGRSSADINQAGGFELYVCPTNSVPVDLNGNVLNANVAQYRCKPQ